MGIKTYRIRCTTDNVYRNSSTGLEDPVPTLCPDDPAHTIDPNLTTLILTEIFGFDRLYFFEDGRVVLDEHGDPYIRGDLEI